MKTLTEVIHEADQLSIEDQAGLTTHLLARQQSAPLGPDAEEVLFSGHQSAAGI